MKSTQTEIDSILLTQAEKFKEWQIKDKKLIGSLILGQTFRINTNPAQKWLKCGFTQHYQYERHCKVEEDWESLEIASENDGLNISGMLVTPCISMNLRSLAIEANVKLRLHKSTSFYMFFRVSDEISIATPIVKVIKDCSLHRIFVMFGFLDKKTFECLKQIQFTECDEVCEIGLCITDNGDDKFFLYIETAAKTQGVHRIDLNASGYLPVLSNCTIALAGSGNECILKDVSLIYRDRISMSSRKKHEECACNLF